MRVALLSATAQTGDAIGNQLAEKLTFFLERGADVRVFLDSGRRLHPALRGHAEVPRDPATARRFLASADLVIVDYSQSYRLLDLLPALAGGRPRLIFDYHGVTPEQLGEDSHREVLRESARRCGLVWCADAAVVHSDFAGRELLDPTGFPRDRVARLGYAVDTDWFSPGPPVRSLRAELGLEGATVLLFVGRLAPNKRVPVLVEALARLRERTLPVHAVIVGDDSDIYQTERRRCEERAAARGVADRLHFLGLVDDARLRDAYRSADVFVMPSRHEGFCVPVVEAMACGLPVVAAGAGALPETVGDAGIAFTPDDADDLARQALRVIGRAGSVSDRRSNDSLLRSPVAHAPGSPNAEGARVAVVACRYGPDIVGGAEASLRTIAEALHQDGNQVEVFTTCMRGENPWGEQSAEGPDTIGGLPVQRFRLDSADADRHRAAQQLVEQAGGAVPAEVERDYLCTRSRRLLAALAQRYEPLDAIIVGPYLTGLAFDVARQFPDKTLLLPCFHDEPSARLPSLRTAYRQVGGILYHSPEEQTFAERDLAVNHPRAVVCGTRMDPHQRGDAGRGGAMVGAGRRYVLYGGRYSPHKDLPTLLDWAGRYSRERPNRFTFAFCGQGEMDLPRAPWLRDLGHLDRAAQLDLVAGADLVVQLSHRESLSLVALEAWAQSVPVLANAGCPVLAGHIERSQGGRTVAAYEDFAAALDDCWEHSEGWREMGRRGREYVVARYGSSAEFVGRLTEVIRGLRGPLAEQMRERGRQRAVLCNRAAWRERFAVLVDEWLHAPPRPVHERIEVEARVPSREAVMGTRSVLVPVRVRNQGTHAVVAEGPARGVIRAEVLDADGRLLPLPAHETPLATVLVPGQTELVAVLAPVPEKAGTYTVRLRAERSEGSRLPGTGAEVRLLVAPSTGEDRETRRQGDKEKAKNFPLNQPPLAGLPLQLQAVLAAAASLQRLPDDYLDVTEGWFARWKRWAKHKLLHNFRRAYVDVLSRQQSAFNRQALLALQELAETCAALEARLAALQRSVAEQEKQLATRQGSVVEAEGIKS